MKRQATGGIVTAAMIGLMWTCGCGGDDSSSYSGSSEGGGQAAPLPSIFVHNDGSLDGEFAKDAGAVDIDGQPFGRALSIFTYQFALKYDIDEAGIEAAGVSMEKPITLKLENPTSLEFLAALLREADGGANTLGVSVKDQLYYISSRQKLAQGTPSLGGGNPPGVN